MKESLSRHVVNFQHICINSRQICILKAFSRVALCQVRTLNIQVFFKAVAKCRHKLADTKPLKVKPKSTINSLLHGTVLMLFIQCH